MRRFLAPVTPMGWVVLATGAAALAAGRGRGWVEAGTAGAVLVVLFVVSIAFTVGRSAYAVTLELVDARVRIGQRALGRVEVVARGRLLPARVELPVGTRSTSFALPWMVPGAVHEDTFSIPTTRRGVIRVGPVRSVRGDPWGLLRRRVRWTDAVDLYVHPAVVALTGTTAGVLRDLEGQSTRELSNNDMSFHALRAYVAGDDRRNIHWKTTARTGRLMVRQYEDTRRTHTALVLATNVEDFAGAAEFELAVSVTASLGVGTILDERGLSAWAGGTALRSASPVQLLDDCSGLTAGGDRLRAPALTALVARRAPGASVVLLVVGSAASGNDVLAAVRVLHGVRTVVVTCAVGEPVSVKTRGVVSFARLGVLADLPQALLAAGT
ncbi:MAG TPA: DUF58 domain-containing protein [Cellulomonadaceae bacterium]|nr:DUF58 domain-containing protein [Cellulomonadaceae bacterium]